MSMNDESETKYRCIVTTCPHRCTFSYCDWQTLVKEYKPMCKAHPEDFFIMAMDFKEYDIPKPLRDYYMELYEALRYADDRLKEICSKKKEDRDWFEEQMVETLPAEIRTYQKCLYALIPVIGYMRIKKEGKE